MDGMIYTAMNNAQQVLLKQATNAHNLANANTTAFKASLDHFIALPIYGPGKPTRVVNELNQTAINFTPGAIEYTGRDLDVAIDGEGFIAVLADDGNEVYTRMGQLKIDANGLLNTAKGNLVLGNGGPITLPPFEKIDISADGTISLIATGQTANTIAAVDRIKLVNPATNELARGEDGLFYRQDNLIAQADANVTLAVGSIENSNVNVIDNMVTMIELARAFELNTKMMKLAEDNDAATTQLLRLNS